MEIAFAAAVGAGGGLFSYNRKNFMFDKGQQMKREYQSMGMQIKQFELYREDVRDLVELTVSKMDQYLLVAVICFGFVVMLFTEGRPKEGSPGWLHWLYALSNAGAAVYFLLAIWMSMHASISSHSFGVRLLTQYVRLPVPNKEQLDAAKAQAEEYEGGGMKDFFKVPVLAQMQMMSKAMEMSANDDEPSGLMGFADASGNPTQSAALALHIQYYRQLQVNWQAYDAYTRVSLAMGMNQLCFTLIYYNLGMMIGENGEPVTGTAVAFVLATAGWLLLRVDLYLSRKLLSLAALMFGLCTGLSLLAMIAYKLEDFHSKDSLAVCNYFVVVVYLTHIGWMFFIMYFGKGDDVESVSLPTKFRSVLYLDVFGWKATNRKAAASVQQPTQRGQPHENASVAAVREELAAGGLGPSQPKTLPGMCASLRSRCRVLKHAIVNDLVRWESEEVLQFLHADVVTKQLIARLRRNFNAQAELCDKMVPDDGLDTAGEIPSETLPVWLKLEWNTSGHSMPFYYKPDTSETQWTEPEEKCRISVLTLIRLDLEELTDKLRTLNDLGEMMAPALSDDSMAHPGSSMQPASMTQPGSSMQSGSMLLGSMSQPGSLMQPGSMTGSTTQPGSLVQSGSMDSNSSKTVGSNALASMANKLVQDQLSENVQPSATSPYAGWEAAQIQPGQDTGDFGRIDAFGGGDTTVTVKRRPPGLMPWRTFFIATAVLMIGWIFAAMYSILYAVLGIKYTLLDEVSLELVHKGEWPHPLFSPIGIACHPGYGSDNVLVAGKYSVHELHLGVESGRVQPALRQCLGKDVDFHAGGIETISIHCTQKECKTLLSGSGADVLQCTMQGKEDDVSRLTIHGDQLRGLSVGFQDTFWAIGEEGLIQFQPLENAEREFVPQSEIPFVGKKVNQLHALSNHTVLGLERQGIVHAFPLRGGPIRSWHLSRGGDWTDVCATDNALYFLGSRSTGTRGVWRVNLPSELNH